MTPMTPYWIIVVSLVGDYLVQSDWMATEKTKRTTAALAHAIVYTLCFLVLTRSPRALAIIGASHFAIDRWRLARFVCYAKNFLAPPYTYDSTNYKVLRPWVNPHTSTLRPDADRPPLWVDNAIVTAGVGGIVKILGIEQTSGVADGWYEVAQVGKADARTAHYLWPLNDWWAPWAECSVTGYHKTRPAWLATWLMIIADNVLHLIVNGLAVQFYG